MLGLLYSEAENAYATHFYVTSLNALELKVTPFLRVALVYRESIATVTVKRQYSYNTSEIWAVTTVLMKTYFASLVALQTASVV